MGLDTDFPSFSRRCPPRALLPPGILACWPSGCTGHSGPGGGGDACTCWMCPLCGHTKQGPGSPPCRSLVWETLPLQGGSGRGPKQPLSPDHVAHSVTCDFPEGLWHFIRMARDGRHRPGWSRGGVGADTHGAARCREASLGVRACTRGACTEALLCVHACVHAFLCTRGCV